MPDLCRILYTVFLACCGCSGSNRHVVSSCLGAKVILCLMCALLLCAVLVCCGFSQAPHCNSPALQTAREVRVDPWLGSFVRFTRMKTTEFVNSREETVDLNEGHAGSYSLLARVDGHKSFHIQVDPDVDPTQQELVVMNGGMIIAKIPLTDLSEYKQITLRAASADEHSNDLLEKKPRYRQTRAPKSQESSALSKFFKRFWYFRSVSGADRSCQLSWARESTHSPNTHNQASPLAQNSEINSDAQDPE